MVKEGLGRGDSICSQRHCVCVCVDWDIFFPYERGINEEMCALDNGGHGETVVREDRV